MIISCEQCHTRFKVGDDKFANGPIRVRCSKCNHVFLASGSAAGAASTTTIPPASSSSTPSTTPRPSNPGFSTTSPGMPSASLPPQPSGAFNSPTNRSGIFRPPTSAGMPAAQLGGGGGSIPLPGAASNAGAGGGAIALPGAASGGAGGAIALPGAASGTSAGMPATSANPLSQPPSQSLPPTSIMARPPGAPDLGTPLGGAGGDPFRGIDAFGRKPTPGLTAARAPTPDPFQPRQTPSAAPRPASADPFGGPVATSAQTPSARASSTADPFGLGKNDPFAGLPPTSTPQPSPAFGMPGRSGSQPPVPSPFAAPPPSPFGAPPRSPTQSPFTPSPAPSSASSASSAPPADPFAGFGGGGRMPTRDPFAGFGSPSPSPATTPSSSSSPSPPSSSPPSSPPNDPFAVTDAMSASSLFGPPGGLVGPPQSSTSIAIPPKAAPNDPFGGPTLDNGQNGIAIDIDVAGATVDAPAPSDGMIGKNDGGLSAKPLSSSSSSSSSSSDPFGGLDEQPADAQSLFDAPPGAAATPKPPSTPPSAATGAPSSSPSLPAPPRTDVHARLQAEQNAKLREAERGSRIKDVLWAAAQVVLALVFLAVAVVIGRGGRLDDVMKGDIPAMLGTNAAQAGGGGGGAGGAGGADLVVVSPSVSRRTLPSGVEVLVVTGSVHNTTQKPVGGALVNVRFGGGPWASGWAWNVIDGTEVDAIVDAAEANAMSQRGPKSPSLNPGDTAPFAIVVAPAPQEGLKASFVVQAAPPRPPAAPTGT